LKGDRGIRNHISQMLRHCDLHRQYRDRERVGIDDNVVAHNPPPQNHVSANDQHSPSSSLRVPVQPPVSSFGAIPSSCNPQVPSTSLQTPNVSSQAFASLPSALSPSGQPYNQRGKIARKVLRASTEAGPCQIPIGQLEAHFKSVIEEPNNCILEFYPSSDTHQDLEITIQQVNRAIKAVKLDSSPGYDRVLIRTIR